VIGIDHGYWVHNYYSIFESFRLKFSPKFNTQSVASADSSHKTAATGLSIKKELQKLVCMCVTFVIVVLELVFRRSEVLCVYATKSAVNEK
jgi:hypothetical protein